MNDTTAEALPIPVDELSESAACGPQWVPQWIVPVGKDSEVGITVDDHCFVVLVKHWSGRWVPTSHVPSEAAAKLGDLARDHII
jgi:hypothetical protein